MKAIRISYLEDYKEIGSVDLQDDCELTNLKVIPSRRREGIAEEVVMLAEVVAKKLGYARVYATTDIANKASIGLWQKRKYAKYFKYEKKI